MYWPPMTVSLTTIINIIFLLPYRFQNMFVHIQYTYMRKVKQINDLMHFWHFFWEVCLCWLCLLLYFCFTVFYSIAIQSIFVFIFLLFFFCLQRFTLWFTMTWILLLILWFLYSWCLFDDIISVTTVTNALKLSILRAMIFVTWTLLLSVKTNRQHVRWRYNKTLSSSCVRTSAHALQLKNIFNFTNVRTLL